VKSNPQILHIETATDICSVAISEGDQQLSGVESGPDRSHATLLNPFIRDALKQAGLEFSSLEAVAVSRGPGSYTGLRIGVSTAKGIAYALGIPLLSCGTLENMAHGALHHPALSGPLKETGTPLLICPMLDARRMEVYSCFYTGNLEVHREVSADIITSASYKDLLEKHHIYFFGNGSSKCSQVITHPNAHFIEGIDPSASQMIAPVWKRFTEDQFEDVAYFEPYYLKDFVATIPRKKVL
jgi:tRNA threonylcarbamoyladenosine biosynthesis protein TsaB